MIRRLLDDLARVGYLKLGKRSDDGRPVGWVVNFLIHQRIDRPKLSIIKEFWSFDDASTTPRRSIAGEGKGMEGKGKEPPPYPQGGLALRFFCLGLQNSARRSRPRSTCRKINSVNAPSSLRSPGSGNR